MRILFAGTGAIAAPTLRALAARFDVAGALTTPDKPQGRLLRSAPSPVKAAALELGLPVVECEHVNKAERERCRALGAGLLASFCFGRIFGPRFLGLFERTLNIHPSILPEARGPSPVQAAILSGKREWGISFQEIALQMDCGRLYDVLKFKLDGTETTESLSQTIAVLAADRAVEVVRSIVEGVAAPLAQTGTPCVCHLIGKDDAILDFSLPALQVHSRIRAMSGRSKARTTLGGRTLMITKVLGGFDELESEEPVVGVAPGTVMEVSGGKGMKVACEDRAIWIERVQFPARKEITALDLSHQTRGLVGMVLGRPSEDGAAGRDR